MSLLSLDGVGKFFGAAQVLADVSFRIERGDHVALVGANGAGKSTLLRIVAGLEDPDTGSVSRARDITVAYLPQDPDFNADETLYEAMLEPFAAGIAAQERLRVLESEMTTNAGPDMVAEYGRLQAQVEHAGYDYRQRIERVLNGLELPPQSWYEPVSTLSGGQRTRANLGRTLLRDADILLLDEPTNHLDIAAVEWLERYLQDLRRAFIVVAHDRYLLDRVTRRTLELSFGRIAEYDAPYSRYLELRAERMERLQQEYESQQEHIRKTEEFVRRYGAGQRSKEARGRQRRLERLERVDRPREEAALSLRLGDARRSGDIVLEARRLVAGYQDRPLIRLPEQVTLRRGDRAAIVGPNGSGKTTLLRTFLRELPPLEGSTRWGAQTSVGYYSQTLGRLDDSRTILEEIQSVRSMSEEETRGFLGSFLFSGDDAFKKISVLSGGERSRVALARLVLEEPNVLLLDEPTNHLDIAARDALRDVLAAFSGTLLFVSHDRYLIDALVDQLWVLAEGALLRYAGTYTAFARGEARALDVAGPAGSPAPDRHAPPERRLGELEVSAVDLAARLAEAGPTGTLGRLAELTDRYGEVISALQEAQLEWTKSVRRQLRAFSDSPDRSAAARRQ
ncbi:MAG TPA: ABC-F family ATP-binding cassette domain-containing protein [Chloroflexota bacterium]|nr:ABC-F family ATP-binding cassette domain-containing protein [Chloroflexota bacterium]